MDSTDALSRSRCHERWLNKEEDTSRSIELGVCLMRNLLTYPPCIRRPDGEKSLKICLFVLTEFTNVTNGRTDIQMDRQTPHDGIGRACKASRGKNTANLAQMQDAATWHTLSYWSSILRAS